MVVFPELALSGYPPEDLLLRPSFLAACEAALASWRPADGIAAVVGYPHSEGKVYNAASVLREGRIEQPRTSGHCPTTACSTTSAISSRATR